jgi:hypothetical protein
VSHGFWCGIPNPACNACDLTVVLVDPGSCVRRGSPCACLEVASRVVLPAPASGCCSYTDSRVLLMGEFGLHRGRRGGVPSEQAPTAPGMASQRPRWQHRAGGDGGDVLRSPCVTTPSWAIARSAVVRPLRVSPNPFEGRGVEEGRERVAQCRGVTPAIPHSAGDGSTTAVLSAQRQDRFPEQC